MCKPNVQVVDKYPRLQEVLDKAKQYDPEGIFLVSSQTQYKCAQCCIAPRCAIKVALIKCHW